MLLAEMATGHRSANFGANAPEIKTLQMLASTALLHKILLDCRRASIDKSAGSGLDG
jgi:hypothetical protein